MNPRQFYTYLWRGGNAAYWWNGQTRASKWFDVETPENHGWKNADTYFGVNPCSEIPPTNASGEACPPEKVRAQLRYVAAINCLFAEYDGKDFVQPGEYAAYLPDGFDDLAERAKADARKAATLAAFKADRDTYKRRATARITETPLPPSVVVDSGGGYHCYWLLDRPFVLSDTNRELARQVLRAWVALVGADPGAADIARVLRAIGTHNHKYDDAPQVQIVLETGEVFGWSQFEELTGIDATFLAAQEAEERRRQAEADQPVDDVIAEFNRTHDLVALLTERGYQIGRRSDTTVRLSRPGRDKDQTSVVVFLDGNTQRSYHHSSSDSLHTGSHGHTRDAFDVWTHLQHDGDQAVAYEAAKRLQGKWTENAADVRIKFTNATGDTPAPGAIEPEKLVYKAEDGGVLDVWLATRGPGWCFVNGYDDWYHWCGTHWVKDEVQTVNAEIQELLERLNNRAHEDLRDAGDDKDAAAMAKSYIAATKRTKTRVVSVETMAQAQRGIRTAELNAGNMLNLANGVLDLETFELLPHDPARPMTYVLPWGYDPDATCPLWREKYLPEVIVDENTLRTDRDTIDLLQELVGYTLTTETKHEVMVWLSGEGGNGKTVFITVTQHLLGDLAGTVDFQTLGLPGNYDLADLPGKRFVFSTESQRGGQFAEGLLRRLVSGETLRTRAIYGSPFEYTPVAKIWWAMNDKPVIKDTSNATWRRLKLIPFNRTFTDKEKDVELTAKLLREMPGILNWAIEGLKRLRANGRFTPSAAADGALRDYRKASNPVVQWLTDETNDAPEGLFPTKASVAYSRYKLWAEKNGQKAENSTAFGRELTRLGVKKEQSYRGVFYSFALIDDSREEPDAKDA